MRKFIHKWEWLIIILCGVVVLRIPTLLEPYWYGDEGVYLVIGQALNRGAELYKDIHDNKPPFLYLVAAGAAGSQFWFKFWAMGANLITIAVLALLSKKVLGEDRQKAVWLTVGVGAGLSTTPLFEGNIANAELFFLLFTVGAAMVLYEKGNSLKRIFLGGVLIGLGGLFKIPAVVEAGIWPILWLADRERGWWKKCLSLGGGVLVPLVVSGLYFASRGVLPEYLIAAAGQNIPYLTSWTPGGDTGIYTLTGRAAGAAAAVGVIWLLLWTKKISRAGAFVGLWGVTAMFGALLSGRPYPHYLMQAAGAGALALGILAGYRGMTRVMGAGVVTLIIAAFGLFHFYTYPVWGYYANFGKWILRVENLEDYYRWFNGQVVNNYKIAEVIASGSRPEDKVFVWGDEPMIYALARRPVVGRYTVRYHILDFRAQAATMDNLQADPPKYIVSFGREEELPGLTDFIWGGYRLEKTVDNASIYRRSSISWWKY